MCNCWAIQLYSDAAMSIYHIRRPWHSRGYTKIPEKQTRQRSRSRDENPSSRLRHRWRSWCEQSPRGTRYPLGKGRWILLRAGYTWHIVATVKRSNRLWPCVRIWTCAHPLYRRDGRQRFMQGEVFKQLAFRKRWRCMLNICFGDVVSKQEYGSWFQKLFYIGSHLLKSDMCAFYEKGHYRHGGKFDNWLRNRHFSHRLVQISWF